MKAGVVPGFWIFCEFIKNQQLTIVFLGVVVSFSRCLLWDVKNIDIFFRMVSMFRLAWPCAGRRGTPHLICGGVSLL
jgi:hypothetical protein